MKKSQMYIAIVIVMVIVVSFFANSIFSSKAKENNVVVNNETTKVRVAYLPVIHALPLFVAIEKGYFKEAGLDVEKVEFQAPNQIIDALINGSADFGSAAALGITGIADYKDPGKIKVFNLAGDVGDKTGESLIIPKNSKISSISNLKGKKLGILAGTIQWKTIAREILAKNGLDMDKDVTIVELAGTVQVQALSSGQIDALLALEPIPTVAIGKSGATILAKTPGKQFIADPFWYGAGVVSAKFAQENPITTKKVIAALDKAVDEINASPESSRQYLKGYTSLTDDLILKVPLVEFKNCNSLNDKDMESVRKFFAIFTNNKVIDGEINANSLMYCK